MKPSISVQNVYKISAPTAQSDSSSLDTEWTVLAAVLSDTLQYYKLHGDKKGFERLKAFRKLVLPIISEGADFSPIMLDDAVWTCFSDSSDAYETAKAVLDRIRTENESGDRHFTIKLLLHRGETIIEEKRLFGDAVQLMMELLPHLPENEICLTNSAVPEKTPVYGMRRLPSPESEAAREERILYVADSNGKRDLSEAGGFLLLLRRFANFPDPAFISAWESVIGEEEHWTKGEKIKKRISEIETAFFFEDVETAVESARNKLLELKRQYSQTETAILPVQAVIDFEDAYRTENPSAPKVSFDFSDIEPGCIHITFGALRSTPDNLDIPTSPPFDGNKAAQLYRVASRTADQTNSPLLFRYHDFLMPGESDPCFYCGRKDHDAVSCPSKMLEYTDGRIFEKLGYMPAPQINRLFLDYFTTPGNSENPSASSIPEAMECVYELTSIFQIRYLKMVWESDGGSWTEMGSGTRNRNGGRLWLALDCIRTSKLDRAVAILDSCLKDFPTDYRVYAAFGIVNIEKQDTKSADYFFSLALFYAHTTIQKIHALFLSYRLYLLSENFIEAGKQLSQIRLLDPNCHDMLYLSARLELLSDNSDSALQKIMRLVRENRRYFVQTLIDPDLAGYRKAVSQELENMITSTRDEAETVRGEVEKQIRRLESLFGKDDKLLKEFYSMMELIEKNRKLNSYFGWLDVVRFSHIVISRGKRIVQQQKRLSLDALDNVKELVNSRFSEIEPFPESTQKNTVANQCISILKETERIENGIFFENPKEFGNALEDANELEDRISQIDPKIKRLKAIIEFKKFLSVFGRIFLVTQGINLIIGLLLFPLVTHLIVVNFLELRLTSVYSELSAYIGGLILIGSVFGTLLAVVMAVNRIYSE